MKKVLVCCSSFYPAYKSGGPVRSLCNLIDVLGDSVMFDVLTSDRDMGDPDPFEYIVTNSWDNCYKEARVFYISPWYHSLLSVSKIFSEKRYDILYLNSFFDFKYSIRFLFLAILGRLKTRNIILAPRGELTLGAMSLKPFKKNTEHKLQAMP